METSEYNDVASFQLNARKSTERTVLVWIHADKTDFYHAILLTFRPFLVANAVMTAQARQKEGMWLRQACRCAVGAAQDSITHISDVFHSSVDAELIKVRNVQTQHHSFPFLSFSFLPFGRKINGIN